jgi:hypothetical protein
MGEFGDNAAPRQSCPRHGVEDIWRERLPWVYQAREHSVEGSPVQVGWRDLARSDAVSYT